VVLSVDESKKQTETIHRQQRYRETLEGMLAAHHSEALRERHRNAQRLLRPLKVVNPHAEQLTFVADRTRTRRDHGKYLTLIRAIALLHQYQRDIHPIDSQGQTLEYIEVTKEDIALANRLTHEVLGRTLDELPPQTRRLLTAIHRYVKERAATEQRPPGDIRFSRRELREATGWGNTQLKVHCRRLEDMEYLLIDAGGRGQPLRYRLQYDGQGEDGGTFVPGLIEMNEKPMQAHLDPERAGQNPPRSGSGRGEVGPVSGGGRTAKTPCKPGPVNGSRPASTAPAPNGASGCIKDDLHPLKCTL
jgi:hypothetical protein